MRSASPPIRRSGLAAAVLGLGLVFIAAGPLRGHAVLVGTDPPDGASLAAPPDVVTLTFSEAVSASLSRVSMVDDQGRPIPIEVRLAPGDATSLILDVPDIGSGTFRVTWTTVSDVDLHVLSGWTVFTVGVAAPAATSPEPVPVTPLGGLAKWVLFVSLAAAVGMILMVAILLPAAGVGDSRGAVENQFRRAGLFAVVVAMAAAAGTAAIDVVSIAGLVANPVSAFAATPTGLRSAIQALLLLVALLGMLAWRPADGRRRAGLWVSALALAGVVAVRALGAHQVADPESTPIELVAWILHSGAAMVWIGGLIAIGWGVLPRAGLREVRAGLFPILRRFSPLAAASVAILGVTGLYAAGRLVASVDALLLTDYGHVLLVKGALVGVVALLGLRHALRLHGRVRALLATLTGRLGRRWGVVAARRGVPAPSLWLEATGGVAVLLAAVLLSTATPANSPSFLPASKAPSQISAVATVDDLLITAAISPGRAGANFVNLGVYETRRPALAPIREVQVTLTPGSGTGAPIHLTASPIGDGRYEAPAADLPVAGDWTVAVTVHRGGLADAVLRAPIEVEVARAPSRPPTISNAPIGPALTIAAALLAAVSVLVAGLVGRRMSVRQRDTRHAAGPFSPVPARDR
jgi:copper transport protein